MSSDGTVHAIAVATGATHSTVQLCGEVDVATVALVGAALQHELTVGHLVVRLDLSRLTFLDCCGLREIVFAYNAFLAARGALVLIGLSPMVARMVVIIHLDEVLFFADGERPRHDRQLRSLKLGSSR